MPCATAVFDSNGKDPHGLFSETNDFCILMSNLDPNGIGCYTPEDLANSASHVFPQGNEVSAGQYYRLADFAP